MADLPSLSRIVLLLPWVLPPLLGALIGYVTNALAIRMLFRPLRRYTILGLPVPFTPGVIPQQREELAESIGRMVARDLLTTDVFRRSLTGERFLHNLQMGVYRLLGTLAESSLGTVLERFETRQILKTLAEFAAEELCSEDRLSTSIAHALSMALRQEELLVAQTLTDVLNELRPLEILSEDDLLKVMELLWPRILGGVEQLLREPETQAELQRVMRTMIIYTFDQLNGIQRLMAAAGQYDRQLTERVPSIVARGTAEVIAALHRHTTYDRIRNRFLDWRNEHRSDRLSDLLPGDVAPFILKTVHLLVEDPRRLETQIAGMIAPLFHGTPCRNAVRSIQERIEKYIAQHHDDTVAFLVPVLPRRRGTIASWAGRRIVGILGGLTERFVAHLDIYQVVVDRINGLDIEQVEELLLGIIRRHLRWINLFGALLGAVIGGAQLVLRVIGL